MAKFFLPRDYLPLVDRQVGLNTTSSNSSSRSSGLLKQQDYDRYTRWPGVTSGTGHLVQQRRDSFVIALLIRQGTN